MNNREVEQTTLVRPSRVAFDWYAATVDAKPKNVIDQMVRDFDLVDVEYVRQRMAIRMRIGLCGVSLF